MNDLRYGLRLLTKRPGFTAIAIITLALGIGANSAIFSIINGVLLHPLPFQDPDKVVLVQRMHRGEPTAMSPVDYIDLTTQSNVFQYSAALTSENYNLTGAGDPERIQGAAVTCNFFDVFGNLPQAGRTLLSADCKEGAEKAVVISNSLWKTRFAGDSKVAGSKILLDGVPHTILGVAHQAFDFPAETQIWRPLIFTPHQVSPNQRGACWIQPIARLKKDLNLNEANTRIRAVSDRIAKENPRSNKDVHARVVKLHDFMVHKIKKGLLIICGAVGFVLLIACANVANLLLAQSASRSEEVAVRSAMGASRFRLIRQFLAESALLVCLSCSAGILIGLWFMELLRSYGPADLPRLQEATLNLNVLAFTIVISATTAALVGLVPALHALASLPDRLKSAGRRVASSGNGFRKFLIIFEIALSLMLLTGAGLLIRSFLQLKQINPGFQTENVLSFSLSLPPSRYPELFNVSSFVAEVNARLSRQPGVKSSGAILGLPLTTTFSAHSSFERTGKAEPEEEPEAALRVATPDYFRTVGIPLITGRYFADSDTADSPAVVIINEAAARKYWPGENPIQQKLKIGARLVDTKHEPRLVIGIVGNVRSEALSVEPSPELYIPHTQHPVEMMTFVVRTATSPDSYTSSIRKEVQSLDPELPIWETRSLEEIIGMSMAQKRFLMFLISVFAGIALILGAVGIYGVISYTVSMRTREIGLRMAIGAESSDVVRLFLREGMMLALFGIIAGTAGAVALSRVLESLLFRVSGTDPLTIGAVGLTLASIALLACYLPASRASKINPVQALRYE